MALKPRHPCPYPRCGVLIAGPAKHCPAHTRRIDAARGTAADRGYDQRWADYSRAWLARFPWCGQRRDGAVHAEHSRCVQEGRRTLATITDHIRAIRDGGAIFDPANHQSLCHSCNTRKG